MPSKYDAVMNGLPRLPREPTEYQQRVDIAKKEVEAKTPTELARAYVGLRAEKDAVEAVLSVLTLRIEAVFQLMEDAYEAEGLRTLALAEGGSVAVQPEPYSTVKDKEVYRLWCIEQGMEHSMHLWPSTTQALVKERMLVGHEPPPGVEVFIKGKAVWRR